VCKNMHSKIHCIVLTFGKGRLISTAPKNASRLLHSRADVESIREAKKVRECAKICIQKMHCILSRDGASQNRCINARS
jgi:hypothetical protein